MKLGIMLIVARNIRPVRIIDLNSTYLLSPFTAYGTNLRLGFVCSVVCCALNPLMDREDKLASAKERRRLQNRLAQRRCRGEYQRESGQAYFL